MESTVTESLQSNNVATTITDMPTKEVVEEVGVSQESHPKDSSKVKEDKELSWEKIAAEIAADEGEDNKEEQTQVGSEVIKIKETVITSVTEEKIVTETTEAQNPTQTENITTESISNSPLKEVAEPVQESVEDVTIEAVPVDEVEEDPRQESSTAQPEVEISVEKTTEKSVVEISELKPEEITEEVTETIEDIEYTVVEAEDVETNEIIEEHLAQTNSTEEVTSETVVIINPDQTQTEITIEQVSEDEKTDDSQEGYTEEIYLVTKDNESVDDPSPSSESPKPSKPKKQRGRKPIADIPLHVLGRDISKPTEGVSNGGRTMPKPRLGVKVPYRNLTSQIVSKQEIEKEIMERFKLKQEQNSTNSGDILFARKLTQRLAKKLIPTDKDTKITLKQENQQEASSSVHSENSEIKNNSDLIAILEGDGDDIEITKKKEEERKQLARQTEKEIALQQLKELPGKAYRTKEEEKKAEEKKKEEKKKEEVKKVSSVQKESSTKPKSTPPTQSPVKKEEKKNVEVEPRLKTGMVIKTYTRKRKSTEEEPTPPPKKSVVAATPIKTEDGSPALGNVYITKSSRVIKRKVIWDPDEVPNKSPIKSPKMETSVKSAPTKTVEKKKTTEEKEGEKSQEKKISQPVKKVISKPPTPVKKPKRLTEVDKLLMDEGAVNMLYDVKNNEDTTPDKLKKKNNKSVISLDKAHKELMSKANAIKNDLEQHTNKDVQKSLRKKEGLSPPKKEGKKEATPSAVTRKKSKDSARSSVHSPPSSPPYVAAEASRIIRRHSSSSFSSNDESTDESGDEKISKKKAAANAENVKKKTRKISDAKPAKEVTKNNNNTVTETKVNHVDTSVAQDKTFVISKKNKLVSIKLQNVDGKCYLTEQVLKDLTSSLKEFSKDDDCHVVSITSDNNESFCEGLDYSMLISDDDDGARKKKATEVASLVKEFLRCLLNFPKVLVAGIQGDCVGLGVTMLPLFDMVIASDTSTFSAPYAKLGCVPEAGFLLTVPHLNSNGLASELLYTSQIIKADDAFRRGLVTRLCWPEKYQQELKNMLSQVANQSLQSLVATKQQLRLRPSVIQSTEAALNSVSKVLVEHWTSPECQKNFSK